MLLTQNDSGSRSVRTVPFDNIDGFIVSPDGRHLFINGIADKEAASGIWQYDLASAKLHCVVPASEHPSPYAKREVRSHHSIQLPSGKTVAFDIFSPANLDRQSNGKFLHHNKYPMVIGNSVFGGGMLGGHGWLWVPAMTAGNAYVVIVKRENWLEGIEQWGDNVTAVYNHVTDTLPIDKNQVFLFGASAETAYLGELMAKSPELWKGAILLNPGGLPDFSNSPADQLRPRILISAGARELEEATLKQYQESTLKSGLLVDYLIHPEEGHALVGNAAQLERTKAIMHFVFEE
jgi:hypothetical protein